MANESIGEKSTNYAKYANIVGACISFVVFVGVLGWGARTIMRDSSGVPVVRALEGPMRVSPLDPGGVPASHQGLTVNQVISSQKNKFFDQPLQLAPAPIKLKAEDMPVGTALVKTVTNLVKHRKIEFRSVDALITKPHEDAVIANKLASMLAATPLSSPTGNLIKTDILTKTLSSAETAIVVVNASFRPKSRHNFWLKPFVDSEITARDKKVLRGTQMVQLGAYSNKQAATKAWKNISKRYRNYFVGKENVILTDKMADQVIYRLRVYGFKDIAESRRLCTALRGQNTECYPVVMN